MGLGLGLAEYYGEGRLYVLSFAAGLIGFPTIFSLSGFKGRNGKE